MSGHRKKYDWACFFLSVVVTGALLLRLFVSGAAPEGSQEPWLLIVLMWLLAIVALLQRHMREFVFSLGPLKAEIRTLSQETQKGLGELKDAQVRAEQAIDSMIASINTITSHISVSVGADRSGVPGQEIMPAVTYVTRETLLRLSGCSSVGDQPGMPVRIALQKLHRSASLGSELEVIKAIPRIIDMTRQLPLSEQERLQIAPWLEVLQQACLAVQTLQNSGKSTE